MGPRLNKQPKRKKKSYEKREIKVLRKKKKKTPKKKGKLKSPKNMEKVDVT